MRKLLFFITFISIHNISYSQHESNLFSTAGRGVSTTFVNDYHATGINPANLGRKQYDNKTVTFGLGEGGFTLYSGMLNKQNLFNITENSGSFTREEKRLAAQQFAENPSFLSIDLTPIGIAVQTEKLGGFAFTTRESARAFMSFDNSLTDLIFNGFGSNYFSHLVLQNGDTLANTPENYEANKDNVEFGYTNNPKSFSQIFGTSKISFNWFREFNFSYGKELFYNDLISVSAGIGVKYIQGMGIMDVRVSDGKLVSSGAFSPAINPYQNFSGPSAQMGNNLAPAGTGYGMDFGTTIVYKDKIKVGFSVTNIGSVTYDANVYSLQDFELKDIASPGADNYNFVEQLQNFEGTSDPLNYEGKEKVTYKLPTIYRFGASHKLEDDKAEIGFDIIMPGNNVPGNMERAIWSVGGDIRPLRWIRLSSGFSYGGNFGNRALIPLGITFIAGENGTYEAGFATRDFVTFFRDENPALSFAFGFLRFRI